MPLSVKTMDYHDSKDIDAFTMLLKHYSADPMGGNSPLEATQIAKTLEGMKNRSFAHSFIAYNNDQPAGLMNCFEGFSTFKAQPLINVHDVVTLKAYRNQGVATALFQYLDAFAKAQGFCKITLEVLSNNTIAQQAYKKFGFESYELDPAAGHALFWQKHI